MNGFGQATYQHEPADQDHRIYVLYECRADRKCSENDQSDTELGTPTSAVKQFCAVEASSHRLLVLARMAAIVIYRQFVTRRDLETRIQND